MVLEALLQSALSMFLGIVNTFDRRGFSFGWRYFGRLLCWDLSLLSLRRAEPPPRREEEVLRLWVPAKEFPQQLVVLVLLN